MSVITLMQGDIHTWARIDRFDGVTGELRVAEPEWGDSLEDTSPEASVVRVAVQSGILLEWAGITRYNRSLGWLWLARADTDGKPQRCYPRDIRKALIRAERNGDLTAGEVAAVEAGVVDPKVADVLIQIAVVGRVLYVEESITGAR